MIQYLGSVIFTLNISPISFLALWKIIVNGLIPGRRHDTGHAE